MANKLPVPEFFTVEEVAAILRTKPHNVRCMHYRRQLAGVYKVGHKLLIEKTAFLSSLKRVPTAREAARQAGVKR